MQRDRSKNLLLFHFIVLLFGSTSVLGALISISALPLVIYRMGLAAIGLAIYFLLFHPNYFFLSKMLWGKVVLGGIIIGVHWVTFFFAIKIAGVSLALSMMATGALITAILDPLINRRKLLGYELIFGGLTTIGIGIIYQAEFEHIEGISIALLSAFLSSLFTIINSEMVIKARPITLSFYELVIGFIIGVLVFFFSDALTIQSFKLKEWDIVWIIILAFLCTSYAFNVSIKVMRHLSSFTIMMVISLEPIYGIILSLLIWNDKEYLSVNFYVGFLIVIFSILMNGIYKLSKETQKNKSKL